MKKILIALFLVMGLTACDRVQNPYTLICGSDGKVYKRYSEEYSADNLRSYAVCTNNPDGTFTVKHKND